MGGTVNCLPHEVFYVSTEQHNTIVYIITCLDVCQMYLVPPLHFNCPGIWETVHFARLELPSDILEKFVMIMLEDVEVGIT